MEQDEFFDIFHLVVEREALLGGILKQCIHDGFGLTRYGEALTGPEYAERYSDMVKELGIAYETGTMVLDIAKDKTVTIISSTRGVESISAKAVILAMNIYCRNGTETH